MTKFKLKVILLIIVIISSLVLIGGSALKEKTLLLEQENKALEKEVLLLMQANDELLLEHQEEVSIIESKLEDMESKYKRVKNQLGSNQKSKPTDNTNEVSKSNQEPNRGDRRLIGTFHATAYDDSVESQGQWVGQTATGMKPQVGVIAVDPNVIPLHTKLYVEDYGNCIAGDTGGAIKGNRIDVFKNTASEVRQWGRRDVKVYIRE